MILFNYLHYFLLIRFLRYFDAMSCQKYAQCTIIMQQQNISLQQTMKYNLQNWPTKICCVTCKNHTWYSSL